jgi:hypothetical protein
MKRRSKGACAHDHEWLCTRNNRLFCSACRRLLIPMREPFFGPEPDVPKEIQDQVDQAIREWQARG